MPEDDATTHRQNRRRARREVQSQQEDEWLASRPGDSGGPVVLPTSRGLMAKGTIVGGDDGDDLFWQDFGTAVQIWGAFPIV